jgi:hypothetical protein
MPAAREDRTRVAGIFIPHQPAHPVEQRDDLREVRCLPGSSAVMGSS